MSFSVTSPVTGGAQTGFTTPAYVLATDTAPTNSGKQYAVSSITGTQAGVDTSSTPSRPFTTTLSRPAVLKTLPAVDPVTGQLRAIPRNTYKHITRKGVTPLSGQPAAVMNITTQWDVPAGADSADAANVRAAWSLHSGVHAQISAAIGDTLVSGVI